MQCCNASSEQVEQEVVVVRGTVVASADARDTVRGKIVDVTADDVAAAGGSGSSSGSGDVVIAGERVAMPPIIEEDDDLVYEEYSQAWHARRPAIQARRRAARRTANARAGRSRLLDCCDSLEVVAPLLVGCCCSRKASALFQRHLMSMSADVTPLARLSCCVVPMRVLNVFLRPEFRLHVMSTDFGALVRRCDKQRRDDTSFRAAMLAAAAACARAGAPLIVTAADASEVSALGASGAGGGIALAAPAADARSFAPHLWTASESGGAEVAVRVLTGVPRGCEAAVVRHLQCGCARSVLYMGHERDDVDALIEADIGLVSNDFYTHDLARQHPDVVLACDVRTLYGIAPDEIFERLDTWIGPRSERRSPSVLLADVPDDESEPELEPELEPGADWGAFADPAAATAFRFWTTLARRIRDAAAAHGTVAWGPVARKWVERAPPPPYQQAWPALRERWARLGLSKEEIAEIRDTFEAICRWNDPENGDHTSEIRSTIGMTQLKSAMEWLGFENLNSLHVNQAMKARSAEGSTRTQINLETFYDLIFAARAPSEAPAPAAAVVARAAVSSPSGGCAVT